MKLWAAALLVVAILVSVISCEVSVWGECRRDHSWMYCMRVLNK
jgi:hypothetical protein